ncbi:hypothetical protein ABK040_005652 [Willaertia magna]
MSELLKPEEQGLKEICISTSNSEEALCYLWDIKSGQVLNTLKRIKCQSHSCCFIPEHLYFIASQQDKNRLFIYDIRKEQPLFECPTPEKITTLANYGSYCFGGGEKGTIYIWHIFTGKLMKLIHGHMKQITCMTVNQNFLVTGSLDTLVHVWNLSDLLDIRTEYNSQDITPIYSLSSHALAITSIQLTNSKLISTSLDRTCKIWDLSTGIEICSIIYPSSVHCAILNTNEHDLFVGCANGLVYQISLYPYQPQYLDEQNNYFEENNSLMVSELGSTTMGTRTLTIESEGLSSMNNNTMNNNDSYNKYKCYTFRAHNNVVNVLSISSDGLLLVSGSKDGKLISWDIQSRQPITTFKKHATNSDTEITNGIVNTIHYTKFSTFHNNENIKLVGSSNNNSSEKGSSNRNVMSLTIKPFKKFISMGPTSEASSGNNNLLEVNINNDNWNMLYLHSDFDIGLERFSSSLNSSGHQEEDYLLFNEGNRFLSHKCSSKVKALGIKKQSGIQKKERKQVLEIEKLKRQLALYEKQLNEQQQPNKSNKEVVKEDKKLNKETTTTEKTNSKKKKFMTYRKFQ